MQPPIFRRFGAGSGDVTGQSYLSRWSTVQPLSIKTEYVAALNPRLDVIRVTVVTMSVPIQSMFRDKTGSSGAAVHNHSGYS